MNEWWNSIEIFEKVYWLIAIPSTLIFLVLAVLTFFGGDSDQDVGGADADIDSDVGMSFQFISVKSLIGFFTVFAWSGLTCMDFNFGKGITVIISFLSGLGMMFIIAGLFYYLSKLSHSGTLIMKNAINGIGEVYLKIPANRKEYGKIHIKIQGSLHELDAITDDNNDIERDKIVRVLDVVNDQILVVTEEKANNT